MVVVEIKNHNQHECSFSSAVVAQVVSRLKKYQKHAGAPWTPADSPTNFPNADAGLSRSRLAVNNISTQGCYGCIRGMSWRKSGMVKNHNPRKRAAVLVFRGCGWRTKPAAPRNEHKCSFSGVVVIVLDKSG